MHTKAEGCAWVHTQATKTRGGTENDQPKRHLHAAAACLCHHLVLRGLQKTMCCKNLVPKLLLDYSTCAHAGCFATSRETKETTRDKKPHTCTQTRTPVEQQHTNIWHQGPQNCCAALHVPCYLQ